MRQRGPGALLVLLALAAAAPAAASAAAGPGGDEAAGISSVVHWRGLLQAADGTTGTPKTAVIFNLNTQNQPVVCINVTEPFSNRTYSASGKQAPTGADVDDLARQICSSYEGAGARLFDMVRAGGEEATRAAQAIKQAACPDPNSVPNAVTVSTIQAQDSLGSLEELRSFFQAYVGALGAVGVPACVTVVESDAAGERVADEQYFKTS